MLTGTCKPAVCLKIGHVSGHVGVNRGQKSDHVTYTSEANCSLVVHM